MSQSKETFDKTILLKFKKKKIINNFIIELLFLSFTVSQNILFCLDFLGFQFYLLIKTVGRILLKNTFYLQI